MPAHMIVKHPWALAITCAFLVVGITTVRGQTVDALLDKLVEKGILTVREANELRQQSNENSTPVVEPKTQMPDWVSSFKFSGDLRGRFEGFYSENDEFMQRERWRYRARVGIVAELFNGFEAGLRLGSGDADSFASGGSDPISNNQTFEDNASKKDIFIDLAYGKWTPWDGESGSVSLTAGKMRNPFVFSDLVFDEDYTPEGAAVQVSYKVAEDHTLKFNGGAFVIDELGASRRDPYLFGAQARLDSTWSKQITSSAGLGMVGLTSAEVLDNPRVPNVNVGNTRNPEGSLIYEYYPFIADGSIIYTLDSFPFYPGGFPIRAGGDYAYNDGAPHSADNHGWSAGITFGKAGKRRTWEVEYTYKWLGANAWWEEMTDSDFGTYWKASPEFAATNPSGSDKNVPNYYAGTNARGHIFRAAYSPYDFLTFRATWSYTDLIRSDLMASEASGSTEIHRLQVDAIMSF